MRKDNKILKAGIGYTIGNYLLKGINFLAIPVFAGIMSTSDYGIYSAYLAYEGFFSHFIGLALHMSLKNAKIKYEKQYNDYALTIIVLQFVNMLCWGGIFLFFKNYIAQILGLDVRLIFFLLIHAFCTSILNIYIMHLSLSYSYKSYLKVAMFNASANIIISIVLITTVFSTDTYFGRIIGTVLPLFIVVIYILRIFIKTGKKIKREYVFYGLKYSLPLVPHALSQMILSQFDRIMVNKIIGAAEAGVYSFAYNIYMIVEVTKSSLDGIWGPWFYQKMRNGEREEIKKRGNQYALGMLMFTIVIVCIAPELVLFLGNEKYKNATYVVIPITIAGYFSFLYTLPAQLEYYLEKTKFIAVGTFCAASLNILLNMFYIPRYGYIAAAYTTEITYILYFIVHYIIAWRLGGKDIFYHKKIFAYMIVCIVMGGIAVKLINVIIVRWMIAVASAIYLFVHFIKKNRVNEEKRI